MSRPLNGAAAPADKRLLLSVAETAQLLGISRRGLYRLLAANRIDLRPRLCGRRKKFLAAEVRRVAEQKRPWR